MQGWFVWCASMVRDPEGRYHLFLCRWPESSGHDGWINQSEIIRAESTSLDKPFEFKELVLGKRTGAFWDADNAHNVLVKQFGDRYYMYYTGNHGNGDYWSHRNNQRIGVAVADHPAGPWKRSDEPLLIPRSGQWDGLMHANPVATQMPDGRFLLMFKGVAEGTETRGGAVRHGVAFAESPTGPFQLHPDCLFDLPGELFPYEDPAIWVEDDIIFCLMKTMDARISPTGEMGLLLFQSTDGINWKPSDPHFVIDREVEMDDGAHIQFERLERPQIFIDTDGSRYLLLAVQPAPVGVAPSNEHILGPADLPGNTPASYHVRLRWDGSIG